MWQVPVVLTIAKSGPFNHGWPHILYTFVAHGRARRSMTLESHSLDASLLQPIRGRCLILPRPNLTPPSGNTAHIRWAADKYCNKPPLEEKLLCWWL